MLPATMRRTPSETAAQAGDVVQAGLGAPLVLDAQARAELLLAGDLGAALLGDAGDDQLGEVVGQLGVLLGGRQHQHRLLLAGARRQRGQGAGGDQPQGDQAVVPPAEDRHWQQAHGPATGTHI
jgi:hypothetical protein